MAKKAKAEAESPKPKKAAPAKPRGKSAGTRESPWLLRTPPGTSEFTAYRDEEADPPALVVQVGKPQLRYQLRCLSEMYAMLKAHGDWMLLGSADEQKPAAAGTVEAWGRASDNPVGGWYGLKKGLRGRFGMDVPPVMESLGLIEVEHNAKNNRMRALQRMKMAADAKLIDAVKEGPLFRITCNICQRPFASLATLDKLGR